MVRHRYIPSVSWGAPYALLVNHLLLLPRFASHYLCVLAFQARFSESISAVEALGNKVEDREILVSNSFVEIFFERHCFAPIGMYTVCRVLLEGYCLRLICSLAAWSG